MKKQLLKFLGLLLSVSFLMIVSCKDDDPVEPKPKKEDEVSVKGYENVTKDEEVKMKPNVIYVKKDISNNLIGIDPKDKTITYKETEVTSQANVGDVLYSTGTDKNPDGYALKVKKVKKQNGNVTYQYEQAKITEVFDKLHEKQTFKVEEDGIKAFDIEKYKKKISKRLARRSYRGYSAEPMAFNDFGGEFYLKGGILNDRLKVKKEDGKVKITYILLDKDKNYKTKTDQLSVDLELKHHFSVENDLSWGTFTSIGDSEISFKSALKFGNYNDEDKLRAKEVLKKPNRDLAKFAQEEFKDFLENKIKIPLASVPLAGVSPSNLVVKPVLDFYLILECNIKGEFKVSFEWKPRKITHKAVISVTDSDFDYNVEDAKNYSTSINGNVGFDLKVGTGLALNFYFPAFKGEDENGHNKSSKIGANVDVFLKGTIKAEGKYQHDSNDKSDNFYIRGEASGGVYYEPGIYAKLYFWILGGTEVGWSPETPYTLFSDLSYNFGAYFLNPNTTEVFKIFHNTGKFENTSSNKGVAVAKIKNDKVTIKALKPGTTNIEISDKKALFKKASIFVNVRGNENNIAPTKPNLVSPENNAVVSTDKTTLRWEKSNDPDSAVSYQIFVKEPNATEFIKVKEFYEELAYELKTEKLGAYSWKIVATDGQDLQESDVFTFTKETPSASLGLSKNSITLDINQERTVNITSGNGKYMVESSNTNVVNAILEGTTIKLTGVSYGSTIVNVTDVKTQEKKELIVVVKSKNNTGGGNYADKVFVKGGTFTMGSPDGVGDSDEHPQHKVTLSDFYIGKYEVTNAQYAEFMNAIGAESSGSYNGTEYLDMDDEDCQIKYENGSFKVKDGKENYPVIEVTWYGAKAYAEWVGGRLPTEAEWEYAARGGNQSQGYKYSGSNNIDDVAWYDGNATGSRPKTQVVGTKQANELGIYDMSGNVWEWCSDWKGSYPSNSVTNPQGADSGSSRVLRGGSWDFNANYCRVAGRSNLYPNFSNRYNGFRVVFFP